MHSASSVDEAYRSEAPVRLVQASIPLAAILMPTGCFLSVIRPDDVRPKGLLSLVYVGALRRGVGVLTDCLAHYLGLGDAQDAR